MQPVIPVNHHTNVFQAMGAALHHIGDASLQYGLVQNFPHRDINIQRHLWAQASARIARHILHQVHRNLSHQNDLGPEIRKPCRSVWFNLTRERAQSAQTLGIHPPPEPSDCLQCPVMDCRNHASCVDSESRPVAGARR